MMCGWETVGEHAVPKDTSIFPPTRLNSGISGRLGWITKAGKLSCVSPTSRRRLMPPHRQVRASSPVNGHPQTCQRSLKAGRLEAPVQTCLVTWCQYLTADAMCLHPAESRTACGCPRPVLPARCLQVAISPPLLDVVPNNNEGGLVKGPR